MGAANNTGCGHGVQGSSQKSLEEQRYLSQVEKINEEKIIEPRKYVPSPKHETSHNWGSKNPIKSLEEGQKLLDTGYSQGKQIYNITHAGKIIKFQPDGTPDKGYHAYEVQGPPDIPSKILKKMVEDGKISKSEYNRIRRRKKK